MLKCKTERTVLFDKSFGLIWPVAGFIFSGGESTVKREVERRLERKTYTSKLYPDSMVVAQGPLQVRSELTSIYELAQAL